MINEVNPIDFIGMEAIRIFALDVYKEIANNKELFTGTGTFYGDRNEKLSQKKDLLDKIFALADEKCREPIKQICIQLFPSISSSYGGYGYDSGWHEAWNKGRMVCSEQRFDTYFLLNIPSGSISQSELDSIINISANREKIENLMMELSKTKRIKEFFSRLGEYKHEIPLGNIETFVCGIFDASDQISYDSKSMFEEDSGMSVNRLAHNLISRIDDPAEKLKVSSNIVEKSKGISALTRFVSFQEPDDKKPDAKNLLDKDGFEVIKKILLDRLPEFAENGKLMDAPNFPSILYRWKDWKDEKTVKEYVAGVIETDIGVANLLKGFILQRSSHGMGDHVSITTKYVNKDNLQNFLDAEALKGRIEKMPATFKDSLSSDQKLGLELFLESFNPKDDD